MSVGIVPPGWKFTAEARDCLAGHLRPHAVDSLDDALHRLELGATLAVAMRQLRAEYPTPVAIHEELQLVADSVAQARNSLEQLEEVLEQRDPRVLDLLGTRLFRDMIGPAIGPRRPVRLWLAIEQCKKALDELAPLEIVPKAKEGYPDEWQIEVLFPHAVHVWRKTTGLQTAKSTNSRFGRFVRAYVAAVFPDRKGFDVRHWCDKLGIQAE